MLKNKIRFIFSLSIILIGLLGTMLSSVNADWYKTIYTKGIYCRQKGVNNNTCWYQNCSTGYT